MPTLHVENVPSDLYAAICKRAEANGISVSDEVISVLMQWVPTEHELARRRGLYEAALRIQAEASGILWIRSFKALSESVEEARICLLAGSLQTRPAKKSKN